MQPWAWIALLLLGAWHGINPAMGWLFAVALGLQKQDGRAVWQALVPIAVGHLLSIGAIVALAVFAGAMLSLRHARLAVALLLLGFGLYRIFSKKHHPSLGGMQVGFGDLALWSFLMASAHGAGLMLLPVLLGMSAPDMSHAMRMPAFPGLGTALFGVAIHTLGYILVTGTIAWIVYKKLGLSLLRKAWLNLDMVWAMALILTAGLTLLIPA